MSTTPTGEQILALPMGEFADHATIRDYLIDLLDAFWRGEASLKYGMTGMSDWEYDLYRPLRDAGHIPVWEDGYGVGYRTPSDRHPEDQTLANRLITSAIKALAAPSAADTSEASQ